MNEIRVTRNVRGHSNIVDEPIHCDLRDLDTLENRQTPIIVIESRNEFRGSDLD
jgi:hypothetical protein